MLACTTQVSPIDVHVKGVGRGEGKDEEGGEAADRNGGRKTLGDSDGERRGSAEVVVDDAGLDKVSLYYLWRSCHEEISFRVEGKAKARLSWPLFYRSIVRAAPFPFGAGE